MKYESTRGSQLKKTGAQAIIQGIAEDKGLYVPETIPALPFDIEEMKGKSYKEIAFKVIGAFFDDFTSEEMACCIDGAYDSKFTASDVVEIKEAGGAHFLELYHGKTAAFKDMAVSILPYLMTTSMKKEGVTDKICILTATSGDTGKAALEGFADVPGTEIVVFYPTGGVSQVQERQMRTQQGANTNVCAIRGNFDDAQSGVKKIFNDDDFAAELAAHGVKLSSANSINVGRLVPQVAYYVYSYIKLMERGVLKAGEPMNVVVPTGNFGNILAAYYAREMGVPINKFICASNDNKVLTDFINTGVYDIREGVRQFYCTNSPSMDILISSNLERLLYFTAGPEVTAAKMAELSATGAYTVDAKTKALIDENFCGYFADEENTALAIRDTFRDDRYLIDPHTAVGVHAAHQYRQESGDLRPMIVASTASPYKFALDVCRSLGIEEKDPLRALAALSEKTQTEIPYPLRGIGERPIRFTDVITPDAMSEVVLRNAT